MGRGGCSGQRRQCLSWPSTEHPVGGTLGSRISRAVGAGWRVRRPTSSTVWSLSSSAEAPLDGIDQRRKVTTYQLQNITPAVHGGRTGKK